MTCAMDVLDTTLAAAKTELDGVITKYSSLEYISVCYRLWLYTIKLL